MTHTIKLNGASKNGYLAQTILWLFWPVAFLPKYLQLPILIIIVLYYNKYTTKIQLDKYALLQSVWISVYALSIILNIITGKHDLARILATFNSLITAIIGLNCYVNGRHSYYDECTYYSLYKPGFIDLSIMIVLDFLYKILGERSVNVHIFNKTLAGVDWINGDEATRFIGFLDYPNVAVICTLILFPLAISYIRTKWGRIISLIYSLLIFGVIYDTNSRSGVIAFIVVLALIIITDKTLFNFVKRYKSLLVIIMLLALACSILMFKDKIMLTINDILSRRLGSTNMRESIYNGSLKKVMQDDPIMGLAVKDLFPGTVYPYGSHSTYIGVIYKTGITGALIYFASYIYIIVKIIKSTNKSAFKLLLAGCTVVIFAIISVEDIDGNALMFCLFNIILSLNLTNKTGSLSNLTEDCQGV